MTYSASLVEEKPYEDCRGSPALRKLETRYRETLSARPWRECGCAICASASIEVIIFRGSNRNKRRGIHNLAVYKNHIERLDLKRAVSRYDELSRNLCAAE